MDDVPLTIQLVRCGIPFRCVDHELHPYGPKSKSPLPGWISTYDDELPIKKSHWCDILPGEVVVDCGAALGGYTLLALAQGATVLAVEPLVSCLDFLIPSVEANMSWRERFLVERKVLWDGTPYPEELTSLVFGTHYPESSLIHDTLDAVVERHALPKVDRIKMDVEAGEIGLVRGAMRTLERWKPRLLIEDHTGLYDYATRNQTGAQIKDVLRGLGYDVRTDLFGPPVGSGGREFIVAWHPGAY